MKPRFPSFARAAGAAVLCAALPAGAADVVVQVSGIASADGRVDCALFVNAEGFPDDAARASAQRHAADPSGVTCRFTDVPAGRAAVAVRHDANANGRLDKNFLGMPREAWGVSNGARPALRAPRFDEAAVVIPAAATVELRIELAR
jgi:uncharacterized protein (DUF2141 family)